MKRTTVAAVAMTLALSVLAAMSLALGSYAAASEAARHAEPQWRQALRLRSEGLELLAAKVATARYHSYAQAQRDGYTVEGEPCVASPDGTMGIHAVNPALLADPAVDPLRPELLLYVPRENGGLRLVGVEYWKAAGDQAPPIDASDRPSLFGRAFDGPMAGHSPAMPHHYDLHVWFWARNPAGMFAAFNPLLSCG